MRSWPLSERGLTLTELVIVGILASLVMLGLVGFYMNSQGTWMDASAQAITQREATTLIESITTKVHEADSAGVVAQNTQLELYGPADEITAVRPLLHVFWWDRSGDSLVHGGPSVPLDEGPSASSVCEQFLCASNDSLVDVNVVLRSAQGSKVELSTRAAFLNRRPKW